MQTSSLTVNIQYYKSRVSLKHQPLFTQGRPCLGDGAFHLPRSRPLSLGSRALGFRASVNPLVVFFTLQTIVATQGAFLKLKTIKTLKRLKNDNKSRQLLVINHCSWLVLRSDLVSAKGLITKSLCDTRENYFHLFCQGTGHSARCQRGCQAERSEQSLTREEALRQTEPQTTNYH